jgi:ABC-type polysaccharide/polyol phosphate transport system ATPase subunit
LSIGFKTYRSCVLAEIVLKNVVAEFPIYGSQPSLRKALFGRAVGGLLSRPDETVNRVVVRALDNVSLTLKHGDRVGIIGHNGAGKTTMLRVLAGIYQPSQGSISINGRVSPLFNTSPGMDMDDTGYENIVTCGLLLGMTHAEIERKLPEIEAFTELSDYLALPTRTYSSGMLVRLGFAIATALDPEILLLDEGLGAGDARFATRAAKRVEGLIGRSSIMVLASHSDELIRQMCDRAILLKHGSVVADGPTENVLDLYAQMNKQESGPPPPPPENAETSDQALRRRVTAI